MSPRARVEGPREWGPVSSARWMQVSRPGYFAASLARETAGIRHYLRAGLVASGAQGIYDREHARCDPSQDEN
jgi:hypothetical protein